MNESESGFFRILQKWLACQVILFTFERNMTHVDLELGALYFFEQDFGYQNTTKRSFSISIEMTQVMPTI